MTEVETLVIRMVMQAEQAIAGYKKVETATKDMGEEIQGQQPSGQRGDADGRQRGRAGGEDSRCA